MLASIVLAWRPFLDPLPIWRLPTWMWTPVLLLPLAIAVAVVYKTIKCRRMKKVPREAAVLTGWILLGLASAAVVLTIVVRAIERAI